MGAGITLAQGLDHAINGLGREDGQAEPTTAFAFVGDSTFFASGITGVVNAVYNQSDMILCVLDNSTTAMTGHQPHPGMGVTMMGEKVEPVDIAKVLEGIGVKSIRTVDPQNLEESVGAVKSAMEEKGVRAIIFKSPCIALVKPEEPKRVDAEKCVGCMRCINEIGCPGLITKEEKAVIDTSLCTGCGLCTQICPVKAIG
jgi:indolepyruvate ferredoxin oxidoreductase alpha subunit